MINSIFGDVKKGEFCIGCAACTSVESSPFQIKLLEDGMYTAELNTQKSSGDLIQRLSIFKYPTNFINILWRAEVLT